MRVLTGIFAGILLLSGISVPAKAAGVKDYTLGDYRVFCFSEGDRATAFEKITLPEKSAALRAQKDANASGMNFLRTIS